MEKQRVGMVEGILGLLRFIIRSRAVTTGRHLKDLTSESCNHHVALSNRPELALLTFLDVNAVIRSRCGRGEKVNALGGQGSVSACQAAV